MGDNWQEFAATLEKKLDNFNRRLIVLEGAPTPYSEKALKISPTPEQIKAAAESLHLLFMPPITEAQIEAITEEMIALGYITGFGAEKIAAIIKKHLTLPATKQEEK